jgi:hypothetical protein
VTEQTLTGRALDAAVAQLLGWKDIRPDCYTPSGQALCGTRPDGEGPWRNGRDYIPRYSTDIFAAWQVFVWLTEREGGIVISSDMEEWGEEHPVCVRTLMEGPQVLWKPLPLALSLLAVAVAGYGRG